MNAFSNILIWDETKDTLHQSLQVLRAVRYLGSDPVPNKLEYSTYPELYGAVTGPLNFGGQLHLDYTRPSILYSLGSDIVFEVTLLGESQTSLFDRVFEEFDKLNLKFKPGRENITGTQIYKINAKNAEQFAQEQYRIFTALSAFKAHLLGNQTPLVLWPHGFDLSFLWFSIPMGVEEKKDPHMNFGFSPGLGEAKPYLYFYPWPTPKDLTKKKLPKGGMWNENWVSPGAAFELEYFSGKDNPEEVIKSTLLDCYWEFSPMIRG